MALKLIDIKEFEVRKAKIYRDAEWNEYRVKFYINGAYQENADFHTDSKRDAFDTARHWVNQSDVMGDHNR